ncbi:YheC/YheD family protein [Peribacillus saganii]|nr:YheC/YheD family protein [Peribacillus saganii]
MQILGVIIKGFYSGSSKPRLHRNYQLLAEIGEERVVFFHLEEVDYEEKTVPGYIYSRKYGWHVQKCPLPRVAISGVLNRDEEYYKNLRKLRKIVTVVNPVILNKWGIWKLFLRWKPLLPYLIDTTPLTDLSLIPEWLKNCQTVFLKPVRGSQGKGMYRVRSTSNSLFIVDGDIQETSMDQTELFLFLTENMKKDDYILQKGISLFEVNGRKLDIRVYLQRDGNKNWQAISTVPKFGKNGGVFTHIARGAEVMTMNWLNHFGKNLEIQIPPTSLIEEVAIHSAEAITPSFPDLAFLGIDIALDSEGKLWVLDLNPIPTRKTLNKEQKRIKYKLLLDFAKTYYID